MSLATTNEEQCVAFTYYNVVRMVQEIHFNKLCDEVVKRMEQNSG